MDDKEKIILYVEEKFLREGFYKTSMDRISSDLKMSKKTIYKYFPSKENLVEEIVKNVMHRTTGRMEVAISGDGNAIEKISQMMKILGTVILKFGDNWMSDMKMHTPHIWEMMDKFRAEKMYFNLSRILEQGKTEGLFEDKPSPIVLTMFVASMRAVINPEFIMNNSYSIPQAMEIVFSILLNGIMTEKGKKIFNKSKNRTEK